MALSFVRGSLLRRATMPALTSTQHRQAGYLVLIPEIGEEMSHKSLLTPDGLPEFNDVTIEKCIGMIGSFSLEYESGIKSIERNANQHQNVFTEILEPLEKLENPLELTWGISKTLYLGNNSLMPTKSYLKIHERAHQARTTKYRSVPIFKALLKEKEKYKEHNEEKQRLLDKYLLEGKLNGLDLGAADTRSLDITLHELQKERNFFRDKVAYATNQFSHSIENRELVKDFPEGLLRAISTNSTDIANGPWKITLQPPVYDTFMQHCANRTVRWNTWQAYVGRCGRNGNREFDTSEHIESIRTLREKQAKLLGYKTYVDMSMETKMAGSVDNVKSVLNHLLEKARPKQDLELDSLESFAKEKGFDGKLELWDIPYWQHKQSKSLYHFDEEKIREYFPLPKVINSLFNLCSLLFKINIVERSNVHTWHKDVKFYDVYEDGINQPIAGFYLDPYARKEEKIRVQDDVGSHITISNRCGMSGTIPLSALIFNFQIPVYGKPSLLSFNEVKILFHKFGHALRNLLTKVNYSEVAGVSNVEWDAAEVCGHVLTHWLYNPDTVRSLSGHYSKDEPLPDEIIENLQNVRGHMAGYHLCKELYLSTYDLELHSSQEYWRDICKDLWPKYNTLPLDKHDYHPCSFTKVMSEEWGAAYYCHLWSRMIAADVYSAFEEARQKETAGVIAVGERYRNTFLALGGACHPAEVFRRFRGRDPSTNALLSILKLSNDTTED